ncbi:MAG: thiol-disulfide oxidoreductase DCC family protein [Planctomycetota bacterium]|jgi:predicted DCC family thiol-disulfide oxidoreductase YuxK
MDGTPRFEILIDGQCPLCVREAAFMRRLDRGRGRLRIVDLTDPDFDPASYGIDHEQAMGRIHGKCADGRVVTGVEVFRRAYGAVGWGWLLAPTAWPVLRPGFDALYRWFARNRLRLTGRGACDTACRP